MSKVCVTGGSGFLASWIVKELLEKGYKVHATTRKRAKAMFLNQMTHADTNLTVFDQCDFSIPESFDKAIEGCDAVIHCASPFFNVGGTRENLVESSIAGTEMVLGSCKKFNIPKVILTASSACVIVDYGAKAAASPTGNHVYTDQDYSPANVLEAKKNWYALSKLLAEERAWVLSKEADCPYQLCVMNPSLIWGPMTPGQTHLNTSAAAIMQYMDGSRSKIENGVRCVVDVRDVAEAHIVPIEKNIGWGKRYLLFGGAPHFQETATHVKTALEELANDAEDAEIRKTSATLMAKVPTEVDGELEPTIMGPPVDKPLLYDCSPAEKELGIQFHSVEAMVKTCVKELLTNGFTGSHQYDPSSSVCAQSPSQSSSSSSSS